MYKVFYINAIHKENLLYMLRLSPYNRINFNLERLPCVQWRLNLLKGSSKFFIEILSTTLVLHWFWFFHDDHNCTYIKYLQIELFFSKKLQSIFFCLACYFLNRHHRLFRRTYAHDTHTPSHLVYRRFYTVSTGIHLDILRLLFFFGTPSIGELQHYVCTYREVKKI